MDRATKLRLRVDGERRAGSGGGGRGFSDGLRREVAEFVAKERAQGLSDERTAQRLGISAVTLRRWVPKASGASFCKVAIVPTESRAPSPAQPVFVVGPAGMRVVGLDVDGVAALWRRLAC